MWAVMGIGLLINTIQGAQQSSQMRAQIAQMQQRTDAMGKSLRSDSALLQHKSPEVKSMVSFDFDAPDFPKQNFDNLQKMQMNHLGERNQMQQNLQQELGSMKEQFFKENHYETRFGSQGKPEVVLKDDGQPQVQKGPEGPEQRLAREGYESSKKAELANKHADQQETFTKKETQNMKQFLAQNANALGDPVRQGELQKMIVESKKKALKLQQDQEDERWKVDLPPSVEIHQKADEALAQFREMEERHAMAEENSEDVQALMAYDQKVAAVLAEKKEEIRAQRQQDNFLMDPRKMMAQVAAPPADFSQQLPGYLTNALFEMGIYSV